MSKIRIAAKSVCLILIVSANILQCLQCYAATYYKYVDQNGTVSFTDNRQSIPEEYRKKAIKITYEEKTADNKSRATLPKADSQERDSTEKKQETSYSERLRNAWTTIKNANFFEPAVIIAIFLCIFIVIGKVSRFFGHKKNG